MQTITKKGSFDACHRILNHPGKCANIHGHTYLYELTFEFNRTVGTIGYPIDFADIKKTACLYIDDIYDHAIICNQFDEDLMKAGKNQRLVWMYIDGESKFCNPSVENIAIQLFAELSYLMKDYSFTVHSLTVYETPSSFTTATKESLPENLNDLTFKFVNLWKSRQK